MKTLLDRFLLLAAGVAAAGFIWALSQLLGGEAMGWLMVCISLFTLAADNRSLRKQLREHGIEPQWGKKRHPPPQARPEP
ncbi:hypothetical protein OOT46_30055 [Aquabacterium sp. A7-Y]|uniref:hypothetical protein n=1 Tax=Aquabacterium sp. A7-Y TaxID=1349605 RepID=UPI00223D3018|nr:hypothetical protein [Aquabacterium sp. A7-Y]MCW7542043.1 hypothetical protein [Aquabacterium sp. A7-Y]